MGLAPAERHALGRRLKSLLARSDIPTHRYQNLTEPRLRLILGDINECGLGADDAVEATNIVAELLQGN